MNAVVKESASEAAANDAGAAASAPAATPRALRQRLRLPLLIAGPLVILGAAGYFYLVSGRYESTDDAYV